MIIILASYSSVSPSQGFLLQLNPCQALSLPSKWYSTLFKTCIAAYYDLRDSFGHMSIVVFSALMM